MLSSSKPFDTEGAEPSLMIAPEVVADFPDRVLVPPTGSLEPEPRFSILMTSVFKLRGDDAVKLEGEIAGGAKRLALGVPLPEGCRLCEAVGAGCGCVGASVPAAPSRVTCGRVYSRTFGPPPLIPHRPPRQLVDQLWHNLVIAIVDRIVHIELAAPVQRRYRGRGGGLVAPARSLWVRRRARGTAIDPLPHPLNAPQ